jgi:hypothetical protein
MEDAQSKFVQDARIRLSHNTYKGLSFSSKLLDMLGNKPERREWKVSKLEKNSVSDGQMSGNYIYSDRFGLLVGGGPNNPHYLFSDVDSDVYYRARIVSSN